VYVTYIIRSACHALTSCTPAAQRIGVFTIRFPDPYAIDYDNNEFDTLNATNSFQYRILGNIQTLSTKGTDGNDPYGILYVPDLLTDACRDREKDHVPANATRLANLPQDKNYALMAVAPWYSAQCTLEYFTSARRSPTKGLLTYLPNQGNSKPPVLNDASWNLQDGGSWQSSNFFPTYAVSSMTGDNIMDQLNQYSGNMSDVPHGPQLLQQYNATDYVRLWATVDIGESCCFYFLSMTDSCRFWCPTAQSMGISCHRPRNPHLRRRHYLPHYAYHATKTSQRPPRTCAQWRGRSRSSGCQTVNCLPGDFG
jgi:hypothetical protein